MKSLDFFNLITLFGAAFLFSTLPLFIILGSFASRRVDSDLAHHLGLNAQAAQIVGDLFITSSAHSTDAIVIALLLSLAGTLVLASSVQTVNEQVFDTKTRHRFGNLGRLLVWLAGLCAWLVFDAGVAEAVKGVTGGFLVEGVAVFVGSTSFFCWSMHFLLAGRVAWRTLLRPASVTALFGSAFPGSPRSFSSTVISDSRLYGKVGVIFSLLSSSPSPPSSCSAR